MKKQISLYVLLIFISCNKKKDLPIVSTTINERGKKEVYYINDFHFTSQLGKSFNTQNTIGKIYIANFFFTSCSSICPPMRDKLVDIATLFKSKDDFIILSFTIDPEKDTIEILKDYATNTGVSNKKWYFLRGNDNQLKSIAKKFRTHFLKKNKDTDFYHSSFVALVDKKQRIRGYYNILDSSSFEELKEDIQKLK